MVAGVGGSSFEAELARLVPMAEQVAPISTEELKARVAKAQALMREQGIGALYLDTSTNLAYFTGIGLKLTERLHGAIIPAEGGIAYLSPAFEEPKTREYMRFGDDVRVWEEHEDPAALVIETVRSMGHEGGTIAIDPATPFFTVDGLRRAGNSFGFTSAATITEACRQVKSPAEIAIMQAANDITLEVHKATARALSVGVGTAEVKAFLDAAHRRLGGVPAGGAAQFGEATAYPHGVPYEQVLRDGDMVLVDTGCTLHGYRSDITRTYVFGDPTPRQREIWELEQRAQLAGFAAAKLGAPCEAVDAGARGVIEAAGFGPGYKTPGLPHRTGHGIGLDVHEASFMVRGNRTPLEVGMCFSIEPMMCLYGEFGVRLEDIAYMTEGGARWFTRPCHSVDDPFGVETAR
ncbi:M24 family metallopeptidase [Roseomonas mucosa]|uniref:X-Pro dipeptidase n=1 Tax=Roseomonas mucosa TaxID=207340 RepID=A0A1S8D9G6_9PROT|nr:Xaa-Pro peptidase family protein [Roseomonas mucosa]MDT8314677.1 Xaa-Pro peptidase family protein [Roseomonas mucosa]MDT8361386.1 Xaa-Pro peptidase family protein [Roseomonas mucosa]ONH84971.1 X-Pro dipeptidase [Roseomonas mucosa]QET94868.1 aminopeptidase P family protein [Roseomonas mucosa]